MFCLYFVFAYPVCCNIYCSHQRVYQSNTINTNGIYHNIKEIFFNFEKVDINFSTNLNFNTSNATQYELNVELVVFEMVISDNSHNAQLNPFSYIHSYKSSQVFTLIYRQKSGVHMKSYFSTNRNYPHRQKQLIQVKTT